MSDIDQDSALTIKDFYLTKKKKKTHNLKSNKTFTVAIYRRVSTQEQATDGQSIEAQKEKIAKFIDFDSTFENVNSQIIDYCDNGYSGKDLERPAVKNLIEDVKNNKLDFIIVVKLDRLSRHLPDMYNLLEIFNKYDIGFISINEKIDTKTAHGRFFIGILSSLSQLEREQTSERVQSVFRELVEKQPLGGKAPFGYFYYKPEHNYFPYDQMYAKRFQLPPLKLMNESERLYPAKFIPLMFNWFKTNSNYRQIALKLTNLGIPTANSIHKVVKEFFELSVDDRETFDCLEILDIKKWNPRSVKDILKNPFYTGTRIWNRWDNLNKKLRPYEDWVYVPNTHTSLISFDEFTGLQVP